MPPNAKSSAQLMVHAQEDGHDSSLPKLRQSIERRCAILKAARSSVLELDAKCSHLRVHSEEAEERRDDAQLRMRALKEQVDAKIAALRAEFEQSVRTISASLDGPMATLQRAQSELEQSHGSLKEANARRSIVMKRIERLKAELASERAILYRKEATKSSWSRSFASRDQSPLARPRIANAHVEASNQGESRIDGTVLQKDDDPQEEVPSGAHEAPSLPPPITSEHQSTCASALPSPSCGEDVPSETSMRREKQQVEAQLRELKDGIQKRAARIAEKQKEVRETIQSKARIIEALHLSLERIHSKRSSRGSDPMISNSHSNSRKRKTHDDEVVECASDDSMQHSRERVLPDESLSRLKRLQERCEERLDRMLASAPRWNASVTLGQLDAWVENKHARVMSRHEGGERPRRSSARRDSLMTHHLSLERSARVGPSTRLVEARERWRPYTSPLIALKGYRLSDYFGVQSGRYRMAHSLECNVNGGGGDDHGSVDVDGRVDDDDGTHECEDGNVERDGDALQSFTFAHKIDPHQIVCRFDLHGTCNDASCPWQHLDTKRLSPEEALQDLCGYADVTTSASLRLTLRNACMLAAQRCSPPLGSKLHRIKSMINAARTDMKTPHRIPLRSRPHAIPLHPRGDGIDGANALVRSKWRVRPWCRRLPRPAGGGGGETSPSMMRRNDGPSPRPSLSQPSDLLAQNTGYVPMDAQPQEESVGAKENAERYLLPGGKHHHDAGQWIRCAVRAGDDVGGDDESAVPPPSKKKKKGKRGASNAKPIHHRVQDDSLRLQRVLRVLARALEANPTNVPLWLTYMDAFLALQRAEAIESRERMIAELRWGQDAPPTHHNTSYDARARARDLELWDVMQAGMRLNPSSSSIWLACTRVAPTFWKRRRIALGAMVSLLSSKEGEDDDAHCERKSLRMAQLWIAWMEAMVHSGKRMELLSILSRVVLLGRCDEAQRVLETGGSSSSREPPHVSFAMRGESLRYDDAENDAETCGAEDEELEVLRKAFWSDAQSPQHHRRILLACALCAGLSRHQDPPSLDGVDSCGAFIAALGRSLPTRHASFIGAAIDDQSSLSVHRLDGGGDPASSMHDGEGEDASDTRVGAVLEFLRAMDALDPLEGHIEARASCSHRLSRPSVCRRWWWVVRAAGTIAAIESAQEHSSIRESITHVLRKKMEDFGDGDSITTASMGDVEDVEASMENEMQHVYVVSVRARAKAMLLMEDAEEYDCLGMEEEKDLWVRAKAQPRRFSLWFALFKCVRSNGGDVFSVLCEAANAQLEDEEPRIHTPLQCCDAFQQLLGVVGASPTSMACDAREDRSNKGDLGDCPLHVWSFAKGPWQRHVRRSGAAWLLHACSVSLLGQRAREAACTAFEHVLYRFTGESCADLRAEAWESYGHHMHQWCASSIRELNIVQNRLGSLPGDIGDDDDDDDAAVEQSLRAMESSTNNVEGHLIRIAISAMDEALVRCNKKTPTIGERSSINEEMQGGEKEAQLMVRDARLSRLFSSSMDSHGNGALVVEKFVSLLALGLRPHKRFRALEMCCSRYPNSFAVCSRAACIERAFGREDRARLLLQVHLQMAETPEVFAWEAGAMMDVQLGGWSAERYADALWKVEMGRLIHPTSINLLTLHKDLAELITNGNSKG